MEIKKKVFIRADGSPQIGLGHLIRCSALGHMLKEFFSVTFYCLEIPDCIQNEFKNNGFNITVIQNENQFFNIIDRNSIVVLDGFLFESDYQKRVKINGAKLVCIDDLHEHDFFADLIINHAPGITPQKYRAIPDTDFALGVKFVLLRPKYLLSAMQTRMIDKVETAFIGFGGSDYLNCTGKVLKTTSSINQLKRIIVVTGALFPFIDKLRNEFQKDQRVEFHQNITETEMLSLMQQSDLAIVPSSGMIFEALAAGCLIISGYCVDNQKLVYEGFLKEGIIIGSGHFTTSELTSAMKEALEIKGFSQNAIDGFSGHRILKKFLNLAVNIRALTADDCDLLFNWVNRNDVRDNAVKSDLIPYKDHLRWFNLSLNSKTTRIYIMELGDKAIGQVRYDLKDGYWLIDYFLDDSFRGFGLGKTILQKTMQYNQMNNLRAIVKEENIASIRTFLSLGFRPVSKFTNNNRIFFTYELHQDY